MQYFFPLQVKELGFSHAYKNNTVIHDYVRELMALPNLPAEHIAGSFDWLKSQCPETDNPAALEKLLRYFDRNWINNNTSPPSSWSNYKRTVRTNNDVEGWHQGLNGSTPIAHPNMYFLLFLLGVETARLPLQIRMVCQQQVIRRCRKETILKNQRLNKLWEEYDSKDITTSAFLRACGKLADHNERDPEDQVENQEENEGMNE